MNKTININLANMFFHIDEEAYHKLQQYLNTIKRSFTDSQGRDEIISDIESRIAELFSEKLKHERQVISVSEVEEVIAVMGQPEDYLVDNEIFEDQPRSTSYGNSTHRKLFRDYDNKYIAGVSSGLAQYFGIDVLWIRLAWIVLVLAGFGTPVLIYILLWVLVPKAQTTSEKLSMLGKPVNITNIEQKIKEGFDDVQQKIGDVDFEQVGTKAKSSASSFFDAIGDIIMFFLKIFAKFFGIILIIVAVSLLIAAIVGAFGISIVGFEAINNGNNHWMRYSDLGLLTDVPSWILGTLYLFALGIPALGLFILALKTLVKNSKSIGMPAKIGLGVIWLASIIGIIFIGSRTALQHTVDAKVSSSYELPIQANDTIRLKMLGNDKYSYYTDRDFNDYELVVDDNDYEMLYSTGVRLIVRSTDNPTGSLQVNRKAGGRTFAQAKQRAKNIDYHHSFENGNLNLNGYFMVFPDDKFNQQQIEVIVKLPRGTVLYADKNTYSFHQNSHYYRDILDNGMEEHYLKIKYNDVECLDCKKEEDDVNDDVDENTSLNESANLFSVDPKLLNTSNTNEKHHIELKSKTEFII